MLEVRDVGGDMYFVSNCMRAPYKYTHTCKHTNNDQGFIIPVQFNQQGEGDNICTIPTLLQMTPCSMVQYRMKVLAGFMSKYAHALSTVHL